MDDMSWFGCVFYLTVFGGIYLAIKSTFWLIDWVNAKDYREGYEDGYSAAIEYFMDTQEYDLGWNHGYDMATLILKSRDSAQVPYSTQLRRHAEERAE